MRFDFIELPPVDDGASSEPCIAKLIEAIQLQLSLSPDFDSENFSRTKTFRGLLRGLVEMNSNWNWKFLGLDAIPDGLFNENYVIDAVSDQAFNSCSRRHRLLVELCFDNRQAIGTNILKLESAARQFESRTGGKAYCLIICADRKALKNGLWDSGVADEEEYQIAISTAYREFVTSPFSLLILRNAL